MTHDEKLEKARVVKLLGINFTIKTQWLNDEGKSVGGRGHLGQLVYPTENLPDEMQDAIREMILEQCQKEDIG